MTTAPARPSAETGWNWQPQPEAQRLVDELLELYLDLCAPARELAGRLKTETGTRFKDWVDAIFLPAEAADLARLADVGFEEDTDPRSGSVSGGVRAVYRNHLGLFPAICLIEQDHIAVAIKCERVADAMARLGQGWGAVNTDQTVGPGPFSRTRWAQLATDGEGDAKAELWAIERHGCTHFGEISDNAEARVASLKHLERFCNRKRDFGVGDEADKQGFAEIHRLIDDAMNDLQSLSAGELDETDAQRWVADLFFQAERDYWMSRNNAARVQYARQQRLGLGFANHDHHTYRCSREQCTEVIAVFEKLGFYCREKFYAGGEAHWGAQVLEHPSGFIIFADVDMRPDEIEGDFPHEGFGPKDDVHTVGLWVALHGESLLQAGMHHLECQFDWHALKAQLESEAGIGMMDPFTTFPYLRQAFTEGEQWSVSEQRVAALQASGRITGEEADRFRSEGARGSHMENLERNDGFKGFNQQGVSDIIARTDARR
ncbi:MAG: hypothetical protein AAFP26_02780 [Planctomycetota bacterium]